MPKPTLRTRTEVMKGLMRERGFPTIPSLYRHICELAHQGRVPNEVSKGTIRSALNWGASRESLVVIAAALGVDVSQLVDGQAEPGGPPPAAGRLRILVVLSGSTWYTRDIRDGLKAYLEQILPGRVRWADVEGPNALSPEADRQRAREEIAEQLRIGCHYCVGIGTQGSVALAEALGPGHREPFIFLGVTDPVSSHLVRSLTDRHSREPVTGVCYGPGAGAILERIRNVLFPDRRRRIIFVYCDRVEQDRYFAQALASSPLCEEEGDRVEIRPLSRFPTARDLRDLDAIYFSWWTFEKMFESAKQRTVLTKALVVATTRGNVEDGHAVAGVSVHDRGVGRAGAEIIKKHLGGLIELGKYDVTVPKLCHWINRELAERRGIQFPPEALATAEGAEVAPAAPAVPLPT
jgi:ABC-type uncharacterized transport system substrate-binding protein